MVSYASDIQTIERTFSVLRALAGRSDATGVTEVARMTGLAKSTCSRILAGLEDLGMVERVEEALTGDNAMNCQLCKYREQIIGYEGDVGAAQVGHHHHVRGIGTDGHDAHDHGVHGHHHHHHDD